MEKIVFGITGLTLGGAERVLVDLANKLVDKYDITIFTLYSKGELEKELNNKIHLKSMYNLRYDELTKIQKILIPLKVLFCKKRIFKKYIKNENYKAEIAFLEGPITRIFSTKSNAKKIAWVHNDMSKVFGKGLKAKLKRILDRNAYEKYNYVIFVSMDNQDKFNKIYDDMLLPHEKTIRNYIDAERILKLSEEEITEKQLFDKKETTFVQVSRLVEQKAVERLIEAHSKIIKQGYKHKIIVIGDGPLKSKLEKKILEEKVENSFILLGAKTNPYPYIKKADYFCLFSYFEGYPMVIEEAKILKKNILITNTSARETLKNYRQNGIITDNTQEGIENAIKKAIANNNKYEKKENNFVYDGTKILQKVIQVIEEK